MKRVVIVGGGFGGLRVAKALAPSNNLQIVLIDKRNHHLFQPLLYQVATAGLSPAEIAVPIRAELGARPNCRVVLDTVERIDTAARVVHSSHGQWEYDFLILACGAEHSYFGHNEWEEFAPGLKTLEQATEIRRRILIAFERAENEPDVEKQKAHTTFVVVGGGPTGVELAGAIAEISRFTLGKDFRSIDPSRTRVILVEGGKRVLPSFHEQLSRAATAQLESLGVHIWTQTRVTDVWKGGVTLGQEKIRAETVIWAAGVEPAAVGRTLGVPCDAQGRVVVESSLMAAGAPNVFVIGDMAHCKGADGAPLPGLAPVAIQQGSFVARQIKRVMRGAPLEEFRYRDKGAMATIGRKRAVLQFRALRLSGFVAWIAWLLVHIYYLIGFKNKLLVFIQWAWSYISFRRGARLILQKDWRRL